MQSFEQFVQANFNERLRSRIDFRGPMSQSDVMHLRPKHLATIVASQYEAVGYSVLEAMSLGCPLVATAVGGIPEVIKDHWNGLLVPSQNAEAMVAACRRLLDNHDLAARIGRQAWQDCREFFGPEKIARQTVEVYQDTIERCRFLQ